MKGVKIISTVIVTDSTCDMRKEICLMLDVEVVSLTVTFGGKTYKDGFGGVLKKLFYSRLRSGAITPVTSQPSPDDFLSVFNKHKALGNEVVYIGISSRSSGTLQAAGIAKNLCGYDGIHIVDSFQLSHGLEALVRTACRLKEHGESAASIVSKINRLIPKVRSYSVVESLKYLTRGGRVQAKNIYGEMRRDIKNLISFTDGVFTPVGKARGRHAAFEKIYSMMSVEKINPALPVILTHSDCREGASRLEKFLISKDLDFEYIHSEIGGVIGTHFGPDTIGVAYIEK